MTNEKRQDRCAEWCGLPYKDDRVPALVHRKIWLASKIRTVPLHTFFLQPAYCTAACLERAREKPVKWEPVAPWYRTTAQLNCTQHGDACLRRATYDIVGAGAACEACAERAGVFGQVQECATAAEFEAAVVAGKPAHMTGPTITFTPTSAPAGTWAVGVDWGHDDTPPTCAGPLATHGTPVLRWQPSHVGATIMLCDACYLEREELIYDQKLASDLEVRKRSTEPPARIGTVPQVVSIGVGIWAARGMRR